MFKIGDRIQEAQSVVDERRHKHGGQGKRKCGTVVAIDADGRMSINIDGWSVNANPATTGPNDFDRWEMMS